MDEYTEMCPGTPFSVGYRWDEKQKLWVVRMIDKDGQTYGDLDYAPSKDLMPGVVQRMIRLAYAVASENL